jgi:hypothetical protein
MDVDPRELQVLLPRAWHRDVPTGEARELLEIAIFKSSMQVGQEARSCSFIPSEVRDQRIERDLWDCRL